MPEYNDSNYLGSMYGGNPRSYGGEQNSSPSKEDPTKAASRVLGGMKVHNSHIKQVEIDGQLVDVPRIEYVKLIEQQVRDLRTRCSTQSHKIDRLQDQIKTLSLEIKTMKRDQQSKRVFNGLHNSSFKR